MVFKRKEIRITDLSKEVLETITEQPVMRKVLLVLLPSFHNKQLLTHLLAQRPLDPHMCIIIC